MNLDKNKLDRVFEPYFKDVKVNEIINLHDLNVFFENTCHSGALKKEEVEYIINSHINRSNIKVLSEEKFQKTANKTNTEKYILSKEINIENINTHNYELAKYSLIYNIKLTLITPFFLVLIIYFASDEGISFAHIIYKSIFMWIFFFTVLGPVLTYFVIRMFLSRDVLLYRWILSFIVSFSWILCLSLLIFIYKPEENTFEYLGGLQVITVLMTAGVMVLRFTKYSKP